MAVHTILRDHFKSKAAVLLKFILGEQQKMEKFKQLSTNVTKHFSTKHSSCQLFVLIAFCQS